MLSCEEQPECAYFKYPLTVKHFLLECAAASVSTMKELLKSVDMRHIIDFIKDINFHHCF